MTIPSWLLAGATAEEDALPRVRHFLARAEHTPSDGGGDPADATVAQRVRESDTAAFEVMYRSYHTALTGFAASLVHDDDIGAEIVSDVFAALWQRREAWRPASVQGYLFGAVRNRALNYRRNVARSTTALTRAVPGEVPGAGMPIPSAEEAMLAADRLQALRQTFATLTEPQGTLLYLRWHRQMRWSDIAHVLGISVAAAEQQHSRLLKLLRIAIEGKLA